MMATYAWYQVCTVVCEWKKLVCMCGLTLAVEVLVVINRLVWVVSGNETGQ